MDEKLNQSFIQLFRRAPSSVSLSNMEEENKGNSPDQSEGEEGDSEEENEMMDANDPSTEITEEREFQNGRIRRKVMFSTDSVKV